MSIERPCCPYCIKNCGKYKINPEYFHCPDCNIGFKITTKAAEQPVEKPLHVIISTGCSICGTDALNCSFWKTYRKPERESGTLTEADKGDAVELIANGFMEHQDRGPWTRGIDALSALLERFEIRRRG